MKRKKFRLDPLCLKSKIILHIIYFLYYIIDIFVWKKWKYPIKNFEENPKNMWIFWIIYLWYKYLFKPHSKATKNAWLEKYFSNQLINFWKKDNNKKSSSLSIHIWWDLIPYFLFNKQSCKYLRDDIWDYFFNADIKIANLECAIDKYEKEKLSPEIMLWNVYFNAHKEIFNMFCKNDRSKYDVLLTANNHILDAGEMGRRHTLSFIQKAGIQYVWSRAKEDEKWYTIVEKNNIKIGIVNYTFSLNKNKLNKWDERKVNVLELNNIRADISKLKKDIKEVKKISDFTIAFLHMGNSYQAYPSKHIVDMFHRVFEETGVDTIVWWHPHEPQPMERYNFVDPTTNEEKSWFAIYSLWDFIAYDVLSRCHLSLILELIISKTDKKTTLTDIKILPLYNCLTKHKDNIYYFRLLNLLNSIELIKQWKKQDFLNQTQIEEMFELEKFLYTYTLPKNTNNLIKKL